MTFVRNHMCVTCWLGTLMLFFFSGCLGGNSTSPHDADQNAAANKAQSVGEKWFVDATQDSGLKFTYHSGHETLHVFPEIMGGGVALFDMDNDGDLDAYLVQGGKLGKPNDTVTNRLFCNIGAGKFEDVTTDSGAADSGYGMGIAAGDYDNDGDVDLYVTNVGANRLLENLGAGKFRDVTETTNVGGEDWSTSAAFVDYDSDGFLDIYVCNYIVWRPTNDLRCSNRAGQPDYCNPTSYNAPQPDTLYHNNGDGTFTDVSTTAGMRSSFGNGLGVVCGDYNQDGRVDIFVANDGVNNQYWMNQGNGKFIDQAMLAGCAVDKNGKAKAGMGTCAADIDNDDDLDLLVVNLQAQADSFFRNEGNYFIDETPNVGLGTATRTFTRFGVGWADFNHDGQLDLFEANGRVTLPDSSDGSDPFAEPNVMLIGKGTKFAKAASGAIPSTARTSRGAAFGDIDNDGDLDIVVVNRDASIEVLRNEIGETAGNWITLRCLNTHGRDDTNAIVRFTIGDKQYRRDVNPHFSYHASNDPRVHLGLGAANQVDNAVITWSDGFTQSTGPLQANQILTIKQAEKDK